mmetsp:Transcript_35565/g.72666  ORF Transcript_35565/g.72666 Transcript_35565/m.72666 type:complete len:253 (-) Transcript_35565:62-820(-)
MAMFHNSLLPLTAGVSRDICQGVFCQQGDEVLILQITRGLRGELEDQRQLQQGEHHADDVGTPHRHLPRAHAHCEPTAAVQEAQEALHHRERLRGLCSQHFFHTGQGRAIHDDSHHHPQHAHISRSPKGRVGKDQRSKEAGESRGERSSAIPVLGMRLLAREAPAGRCAEDANEDSIGVARNDRWDRQEQTIGQLSDAIQREAKQVDGIDVPHFRWRATNIDGLRQRSRHEEDREANRHGIQDEIRRHCAKR